MALALLVSESGAHGSASDGASASASAAGASEIANGRDGASEIANGLSLSSCIYLGTHLLFPARVLAQRSRL